MNRREFLRTTIATTTILAVGVTGIFEIAAKAGSSQSASQQTPSEIPPITTEAAQPSAQSPSSTTAKASATTQAASSAQSSTTTEQSSTQQSSSSPSTSTTTRAPSSSTTSTTSTTAVAPAGYVLVAQLSGLSGKSSAYFNHPSHGESIFIDLSGEWKAFSAVCTHRPCTVDFQTSELYCPCHGATFNASNGSVTRGPAPTRLGEYDVLIQGNDVFVSTSYIN